ncbi:hypothetical protein QOZ73_32495, partial [Pseudomonas aeruginosa]|uniref:hypothetical protein n=1 Tax=Pseudomonas aeruginosa TaxID=287 RepID=UPI003458ED24
MTATTLTALNGDTGAAVCFVAVIEGWPYALTDGDPTQVKAALDAGLAGHDLTDVIEGLTVEWDQRDSI